MTKQFVMMAADIVIANSTGKGFTTEQLKQMLKDSGRTGVGSCSDGDGRVRIF